MHFLSTGVTDVMSEQTFGTETKMYFDIKLLIPVHFVKKSSGCLSELQHKSDVVCQTSASNLEGYGFNNKHMFVSALNPWSLHFVKKNLAGGQHRNDLKSASVSSDVSTETSLYVPITYCSLQGAHVETSLQNRRCLRQSDFWQTCPQYVTWRHIEQ